MLTLTEILNAPSEYEIANTRVLPYAPELVYQAWTNPEVLKKWWGPKGFTNTFHTFNLVPNGKWIFTMHGPDNRNYPNDSVFLEMIPNERLIFYHVSPPEFYVVALFESINNTQTKLTFKQVFESLETRNKIKALTVGKNEENIDRLEAELAIFATAN